MFLLHGEEVTFITLNSLFFIFLDFRLISTQIQILL